MKDFYASTELFEFIETITKKLFDHFSRNISALVCHCIETSKRWFKCWCVFGGSPEEAIEAVQTLFSKRMDTRVVLQPFCPGTEFTVMILQNRFGQPVAIVPTETEQDYSKNQIFDYRRKYLPTNQVRYHCPPRYDHETISRIRVQAEQIFALLDFVMSLVLMYFLLPNGEIWFRILIP